MEYRKITVKLLRHLLILHRCQYKISYQISQYRLEQLQNERNKENSQNIMLQYVPYAHPLSVDEIGLTVGTF